MATTNLFEYYDRVRSNTISDMGKASDVAKKLADRSYADANSRIRDMHDDAYVAGKERGELLTSPIVSLETAAATYTGEQWAANGSKINEAVLNNERFLSMLNNIGIAQYATGNNTFISGIKREGTAPNTGEATYRIELGELNPGEGGPNLRFKALDTRKTDEQGDLLITESQFSDIFEDYQRNVQVRVAPRVGSQMQYDYIAGAGSQNLNVSRREIPEGQTDIHGTNYGGGTGNPETDDKAFTGDVTFNGDVLNFLEERGLEPVAKVKQLVDGGVDAILQLTNSEIAKLEAQYGIPMQNANLEYYRDELSALRAASQTAQNTLNNKDLNLTEDEVKELKKEIKFNGLREKKIMGEVGDAGEFLAGGLNVTLAGAVSQEERFQREAEEKLFRDPQLKALRRALAKEQRIFENAPDGNYKDQSGEKVAKLEAKISERESKIDKREIREFDKDEMNRKISKILENPTTTFMPRKQLVSLLEEQNYVLSDETKGALDEYINANLVENNDGSASVSLTEGVEYNSEGIPIKGPSGGSGRSVTKIRGGIDNRAFSILLAMDIGGATNQDILGAIETMRYTGTLDSKTFQAIINAKENLSAEQYKEMKDIRDTFNDKVAPRIDNLITNFDKYAETEDDEFFYVGDDKTPIFTEINAIYRQPAVQQMFRSADAQGRVPAHFSDQRTYLHQLDVALQRTIAKMSNERNFFEFIKGVGGLPDGFATDGLDMNAFRLKAVYEDGASYSYNDVYGPRGVRKSGGPKIASFQLQTLDGRDLGGEIEIADLVDALGRISRGTAMEPRSIINRFEQSAFLYR
jgi:hypothetical protein